MTLSQLRADLATAFGGIPELTFTPRRVDDALPPHAWVQSITATPAAFGDLAHDYGVTIAVAVSATDDDGAAALIDSLIDDNVLADALRTLGAIERYDAIAEPISLLNGTYIGFTFDLTVPG